MRFNVARSSTVIGRADANVGAVSAVTRRAAVDILENFVMADSLARLFDKAIGITAIG
tara:strand:- start:49601 stop:49774 length:174 start_codon:yes stop_codon:yes gene_type:complete